MAKVSTDKTAPQIGMPVGSRKEVEDLGVPTRNISTCSAHSMDNRGCAFRDICDRDHRDTRPRYEIVQKISSSGNIRRYHAPCFMVVPKEASATDNGELYEVIGGEGDTYYGRGSVKRHLKRDPNCNDCTHGRCEAWDDREDLEFHCPEFPAAATHPELVKFARKIMARKGGAIKAKAAIKARLLGGEEEPEVPEKTHATKSK